MVCDDCPVCFSNSPDAFLYPCNHRFCLKCIHKFMQSKIECPMCRSVPLSVNHPSEHIGIACVFYPGEHAGVTISNHRSNQEDCGVVINRANPDDVLYRSGLRRNDILLSINGIKCFQHEQVVRQLDSVCQQSTPTTLSCQVVRSSRRFCMLLCLV